MKARAVATMTVKATKKAGVTRSTEMEMAMMAMIVAVMMANMTNTMQSHTTINLGAVMKRPARVTKRERAVRAW
jgi:hypothetical protein